MSGQIVLAARTLFPYTHTQTDIYLYVHSLLAAAEQIISIEKVGNLNCLYSTIFLNVLIAETSPSEISS